MKNKIYFSIIMIAMFVTFDYLLYLVNVNFGYKVRLSKLLFLINSLLIFLFIENLLYNFLYNFKSAKLKIAVFIIFPLLLSIHIAERVLAINIYYFESKIITTKSSPKLWKLDPLLAHKGIPYNKGTYDYFIGDSIKGSVPVFFDEKGFRTVPDSLKIKSDTTDLYLGCSFTFGEYLLAEDTYPYKTSKLLNHSYFNTAISAYGIAQMKLLADSLLPKNKFKYVFIQLSPWLTDRAMSIDGITSYGYRPFPYFSDQGNNFVLNKLAYKGDIYRTKLWRNTPYSYGEKFAFTISDGIEIEIIDYYAYKLAEIQVKLGIKPKPTKKKKELEKYFYNYAIDKCKQCKAIPILVKMKYPTGDCLELLDYLGEKALIIDLDSDLDSKVKETGKEFYNLFGIYHVHGTDSILFDHHPNKYANELFSNRIYSELKNK
jgi:hypothetical protein